MATTAELVLSCLRREEDNQKVARLKLFSPAEWEAVAREAERQGVGPLLYHTVKHLNESFKIPAELWQDMHNKYIVSALSNTRLFNDLEKVFALFEEIRTPVIALKGSHLAETVYNNIALRTMGDIDLLVRLEDIEKIENAFQQAGAESLGYNCADSRQHFHVTYHLFEKRLKVEVHWKLFSSRYTCQIDHEALWKRAEPLKPRQPGVLVLSPEDLLIYICAHTAKHTIYLIIRMLYDILIILKNYEKTLQWPEVAERAKQWGLQRPLYVYCRLAYELLGAPLQAELLESLRPEPFAEQKYLLTRSQVFQVHTAEIDTFSHPALMFRGQKGLLSKIAIFIKRISLPREEIAHLYNLPTGSWRVYLCYPLRIKDLLVRHCQAIWNLSRSNDEEKSKADRLNEIIELPNWFLSEQE